jgi:alginate O-acetyltransferase complex protein AlgI
MFFNSFSYFVFLPIVLLLFLFTPDRWRWLLLLLASYVFYGFLLKPALLVVLTVVIVLTFWFGKLIEQSQDIHSRKRMLYLGVAANLWFLLYFKYAPFLVQNLNILLGSITGSVVFEVPPMLVSIGLSFFIFQAISYLADIYFRIAKSEPHLGYLALYFSFFPKLLQGPIERSKDLLPQLKQPYKFDYDSFRAGMLMFAWGLFKKIVVADRLALYVNKVYGDIHSYTGLPLILATYLFALQIYFDFSGYTDMALGTARFFNIRLTQNFNSPYLATSVTDFWRRWHISFSRWIFEYVFEPLQMKFRNYGKWGIVTALLVTFILAGLWHGASWTYIQFGLTHGIYLSIAFIYKPYRKKLFKILKINKDSKLLAIAQILITFNLICFSFIFFRANSAADVAYIISNSYQIMHVIYSYEYLINNLTLGWTIGDIVIAFAATVTAIYIDIIQNNRELGDILQDKPVLTRWACYYAMLFAILFFGVYDDSKFIYLKF